MINVILCGGSGKRLWPISRALMPKQFITLFGKGKSLFQKTIERNQLLCEEYCIALNEAHYFIAQKQLKQLKQISNKCRFLLEPASYNTAPAIALSALSMSPDTIMLITPADHIISQQKNYEKIIKEAEICAEQNYLVTLGIQPKYPETEYGYIKIKEDSVLAFVEKPDIKTAESYLSAGDYYWNSGIFCFKAGVFLAELKKHACDIYDSCLRAFKHTEGQKNNTCEDIHIHLESMAGMPKKSIDYALMEKSTKIKMLRADITWCDMGNFKTLMQLSENYPEKITEKINNTKNLIAIDAHHNFVYADKFVATLGVDDLVIVDSDDALLVSHKNALNHIEEVVSQLNKKNSALTKIHRLMQKPWGSYEVLLEAPGYKLKRIIVNPKNRLSLQRHKYRNEHWVLVSGRARITVGDKTSYLNENESTYIKAGQKHRLENDTNKALIIIETQVGAYTGEDDIERLEDDFKRK